jgi:hypothetical protein
MKPGDFRRSRHVDWPGAGDSIGNAAPGDGNRRRQLLVVASPPSKRMRASRLPGSNRRLNFAAAPMATGGVSKSRYVGLATSRQATCRLTAHYWCFIDRLTSSAARRHRQRHPHAAEINSEASISIKMRKRSRGASVRDHLPAARYCATVTETRQRLSLSQQTP